MKRHLPLALLTTLALLPALVAAGLYWGGWRSEGHRAHGRFLTPPAVLGGAEGVAQGDWTLLYLTPAACDPVCVKALHGLRMAHLAQGGEQGRVRRLALTPDAALARALAAADSGLAAHPAPPDLSARLGDASPGIYLIDPRGNAILRYAPDADPRGLRQDLAHLLKHSWVG